MLLFYDNDNDEFINNVEIIMTSINLIDNDKNIDILKHLKIQGTKLVPAYFRILQFLVDDYYTDEELDYFFNQIFNQLLEIAADNKEKLEDAILHFLSSDKNIEKFSLIVIDFIFEFLSEIGDKNTIKKLEKLSELDPSWSNNIIIQKIKSKKFNKLNKEAILRKKRKIGTKPKRSFYDFITNTNLSVYENFFTDILKLKKSEILPYLHELALCCVKGVFIELNEAYGWENKAWFRLYEDPIFGVVDRLERKFGISNVANEILDNPKFPNELKLNTTLALFHFLYEKNDINPLINNNLINSNIFLMKTLEFFPVLKMLKLIPPDEIPWKIIISELNFINDIYSDESIIFDTLKHLFKYESCEFLKIMYLLFVLNMIHEGSSKKISLKFIDNLINESLISQDYIINFFILCLKIVLRGEDPYIKKSPKFSKFIKIIDNLFTKENQELFIESLFTSATQLIKNTELYNNYPNKNLDNTLHSLIINLIIKFQTQLFNYTIRIICNKLDEKNKIDFIDCGYNQSATLSSIFYSINMGLLNYIKNNKDSFNQNFLLKFLKENVIKSNNAIFRKRGYVLLYEIFKDKNLLTPGLEDRAKIVRNTVEKMIAKLS